MRSSSKRKPSPPTGIVLLRLVGKREWIFEFPRITEKVDDEFDVAIEWMHANSRIGRRMFRSLIRRYPEHVDAYHHLALAYFRDGKARKAAEMWKVGIEYALKFLPPNFSMNRDRLLWGFIENRPFLRLYHGYGLSLLRTHKVEEALQVFENILSLNPHDNQGARALVVECNFELNRPEAVLDLCNRFRNDGLEQLVYGRPLALFQLNRVAEAARAFRRAQKIYPRIAEELTKVTHVPPEGWQEDRITLGGADQAYVYWNEFSKFWRRTSGALPFARRIVRETS
jgi:tetratricopeptide (TPR) repeat protein